MPILFVLNGPNLNLLGAREPAIYGRETLADIEARTAKACAALGFGLDFRQTNHEGVLVDWVQEAGRAAAALILNAGAYTHTSLAILDALRALTIPIVEVHLSLPAKRESFRHRSYVAMAAQGLIAGFGGAGYGLAVQAAADLIAAGKTG